MLTTMSEETQLNLEKARATVEKSEREVEALEEKFLASVASQIQSQLLDHAKTTAQSKADLTRELGKERVRSFRAALEEQGEILAQDVAAAASRVHWPSANVYTSLPPYEVYRATNSYIGTKIAPIKALFVEYGYSEKTNSMAVLPQFLYSEQETIIQTRELTAALSALAKAEHALEAAKKADDDATVSDLWGD